MLWFFDTHLAISSLHGKFSFQFRFWAHFFASQNPDTRLKIFPTALKKFALRANNANFSENDFFLHLLSEPLNAERQMRTPTFWNMDSMVKNFWKTYACVGSTTKILSNLVCWWIFFCLCAIPKQKQSGGVTPSITTLLVK